MACRVAFVGAGPSAAAAAAVTAAASASSAGRRLACPASRRAAAAAAAATAAAAGAAAAAPPPPLAAAPARRRAGVVAQVAPRGRGRGRGGGGGSGGGGDDGDDVVERVRAAASRVAPPETVDAVASAVEGAASKLPPSVSRWVSAAAAAGGGSGGGVYVAAQVALVVAIVFKFPGGGVIDGALWLAVGPAALLAGLLLIAKSLADLTMDNLTPLATPVDGGTLISDGVYGLVRHPMYSGLLLACGGLAAGSGSLERLALTALLGVVLAKKVALEEVALARAYKGYAAYCDKVKYKLVPWIY